TCSHSVERTAAATTITARGGWGRNRIGRDLIGGSIGRSSGSGNSMRLVASIGPGHKLIVCTSQGLECDGTDGVRGSQDDRSRKGSERAATAYNQVQARGS